MSALPSAHSPAGASSAHRWMPCPGSVALSLELPPAPTSIYAAEGTFAHDHAADLLKTFQEPWELGGLKGKVGEFEFEVDDEMVAGLEVYVGYIRSLPTSLAKGPAICFVEHGFHIREISELCYGTADYGTVYDHPDGVTLEVVDFKYGKGKLVDPKMNYQLLYYAVCIWHSLTAAQQKMVKRVRLTIAQPRIDVTEGPVRSWDITPSYLTGWRDTVLKPTFQRIDDILSQRASVDDNLTPGDWCGWCPAQKGCPGVRRSFVSAIERATAGARAEELEDWQLGEFADRKKMVLDFFSMIEDEIYVRAMKGTDIPGWKLVEKKSQRVFRDGALAELQEKLGSAIYEEPKVKSPAQVEKISSEAKKLVAKLAFKPNNGLTIAPESDTRTAVRRSAKDVFADIET